MKNNIIYVWSSGLECWEPTALRPVIGLKDLDFLYSKIHGNGKISIYRDNLWQFFATYYESLK